jgi:predicted small lipoprotein YifL
MRRAWLLLTLATLAAGGCGQKGPLYLPDKVGKVVTSVPPAPQAEAQPTTPATAPPPGAAPAVPPKPTDKDKDRDPQPPK